MYCGLSHWLEKRQQKSMPRHICSCHSCNAAHGSLSLTLSMSNVIVTCFTRLQATHKFSVGCGWSSAFCAFNFFMSATLNLAVVNSHMPTPDTRDTCDACQLPCQSPCKLPCQLQCWRKSYSMSYHAGQTITVRATML